MTNTTQAPKPVATKAADKPVAKASPKSNVTFGTWLHDIARARGELAAFVKEARDPKKGVELELTVDAAKKRKLGKHANFELAVARYEGFVGRGSQAGMRKRSTAVTKKAA